MNISIISSICISIRLMMTGINISIIISIIMTGINSDPRRQGNRTQPCSSNKKSFKASLIIIINIMMIINEITMLMICSGQVHGRSLCGEVYEEAHLAETHSSVKQVSIIDIINMVNIIIKNIIISLFSASLSLSDRSIGLKAARIARMEGMEGHARSSSPSGSFHNIMIIITGIYQGERRKA